MMKTNDPFDRDEILNIVRHTIEEVSGENGNLSTIVQRAMAKLSSDGDLQQDPVANLLPIPLADVAAYVDGSLTDSQKRSAIHRALRIDPGLMMEIVSAIRGDDDRSPVKLSAALRTRLVALQPDQQRSQTRLPTPPPVAEGIPPAVINQTYSRQAIAIKPRPRRSTVLSLALLATAASILLAIGGWILWTPTESTDSVADDSAGSENESLANQNTAPPLWVDQSDPPRSIDRIRSSLSPSTVETERTNPREHNLVIQDMAPDPASSRTPTPETPSVVNQDQTPMLEPGRIQEPDPAAPETTLVAHWNQIDGILLRRPTDRMDSIASSVESVPQVVVAGNAMEWTDSTPGTAWRFQTLPLCRATAQLAAGGELVLAADTQVDFSADGVFNLHHGSLALLEFGVNTVVRLGSDMNHSVSLTSPTGGSALVRKTLSGFEIDLTGEPVFVNQQPYADARLHVEETSLAVQEIDEAPERLPRWTRERIDRIAIGRNVLAQLNESADVRETMMQSLHTGAVRGDAAATLRVWLIAASEDNLLRLIGSQDPLIRETALQHLYSINPNDPRHRLLWRALLARVDTPRTLSSLRTYFIDLWSGRRPNAIRAEQLLRLYQSPDPATRATANYLLNRFYGAGPRFELNDPATSQTRAVNAWRLAIQRMPD